MIATGLLAAALGVNLLTPPIASGVLRASLGGELGTSDVRVRVDAWPPSAVWVGRIDALTVAARHLRMGTLAVDALDLRLGDLRLDPEALYLARMLVIQHLGSGVARATVSEGALRQVLASQPSLRDVSVAIAAGRVSVGATVSVLGAPVRATGDGRLVVRDGTSVDLVLDRLAVAGVPLPAAVAEQVMRSVNPVVDVRSLPFSLRLVGLRVADGKATLDASVRPR